ncbi:hypothetical protein XENORESO_006320 [Xenotaenia resolanae]|uniref:Uncharacterized protein n=1 Tax=Xenotaenia resolanae TaxID=208358 RepID=A0ABV0X1M4_9TELE
MPISLLCQRNLLRGAFLYKFVNLCELNSNTCCANNTKLIFPDEFLYSSNFHQNYTFALKILVYKVTYLFFLSDSLQRMKKLTTPSPDLKMRGKLAALSPYAVNDAKLKADGKISTISEKETHF